MAETFKTSFDEIVDDDLKNLIKRAVDGRRKAVSQMRELERSMNIHFKDISNMTFQIDVSRNDTEILNTTVKYVGADEGYSYKRHYEVEILNVDKNSGRRLDSEIIVVDY